MEKRNTGLQPRFTFNDFVCVIDDLDTACKIDSIELYPSGDIYYKLHPVAGDSLQKVYHEDQLARYLGDLFVEYQGYKIDLIEQEGRHYGTIPMSEGTPICITEDSQFGVYTISYESESGWNSFGANCSYNELEETLEMFIDQLHTFNFDIFPVL